MQGENKRCPLQTECERRCRHTGRELECDYYRNNAREELVIEDQEELRAEEERRAAVETLERELAEMDEDCEDEEPASGLPQAQAGKLVWLPVEQLHPHPDNPRKAHEVLEELDGLARNMRAAYVSGLTVTAQNRERMLRGAVSAMIAQGFKYGGASGTELCRLAGMTRAWAAGENERCAALLLENLNKLAPAVIYEAFADRNEYYYTRYKGAWPTHEKNLRLDLLYDWLISLGYDMSDEERELRDGTHAMLRDPEKERDDAQGL